ncbi:hypothetical protein ACQ4LE_000626 [Meloidogyne hapla]
MGNCLSNIFIQRGMDLILRFLQIRQSTQTTNLSHSPNPDGPVDDLQDDIRAEGTQRVRIEVPRQELTETLLQEYLELERMAKRLERKQVLSNWEAKSHLADEAMRKLVQLEANHKELKKQTEKARADLEHLEQPAIRAHLRQQGTHQSRHEKAKELVESAIIKEDNSFKELAAIKAEYSRAQLVANRHREKCEKLENAHQRQEEILCAVNGSAEYMDLVTVRELETAQDWLQRVTLAKFKWTNGRALIIHASIQLAYGLSSWQDLPQINGARSRYFTAAEARNNFVTAINNIQSCRVYLGRVRFPYATEEEIQSMELAIQNAFNDLQSNVALKRVMTICQGMQDKLNSLISWFDKVINQTIIRDLDKANSNVEKLWTQTRELRIELLRKLVHEKLGRELEAKELEVEEMDKEDEEDDTFEDKEIGNEERDLNEVEVNNEEEEEVNLEEDVKNEERELEEEEELREEGKSRNEDEEGGNDEEGLKNDQRGLNEEKEDFKTDKADNAHNKSRKVIIPHYQADSTSDSPTSFSSHNLYEDENRKDDDVKRRIRQFEQIRHWKRNEPTHELERKNTLQEKLRIRRYHLERRHNEARKLAEQFRQQWKIAIGYSSFDA